MSDTVSSFVVYEDGQILAVNKPAGISSIHDSHHLDTPNLLDQLQENYGQLWVVHRLDRETSGIMIFARTRESHKNLNNQFLERKISKEYFLLACGAYKWKSIDANFPLLVDADRQHRTIVDPTGGKPAHTFFEVLNHYEHDIHFILAKPYSGYTHQIRAHLSALNGSILCDRLYRPHPNPPGSTKPYDPSSTDEWVSVTLPIYRTALHASSITFIHPEHGNTQTLSAPLLQDFEKSLAILNIKGQE